VWQRVRQGETERSQLAAVPAVAISVALGLALLCGALYSVAALRIDALDASTVQLLWTLTTVVISVLGVAMGTFIAATCVLSHRNAALPAWTNYVGGLAALVFLAGSTAMLTTSPSVNALSLVAFAVMCVWIVSVSVALWNEA
jgi:hypothetical protein